MYVQDYIFRLVDGVSNRVSNVDNNRVRVSLVTQNSIKSRKDVKKW